MSDILQTALDYQQHGFSVIPVRRDNKKPPIKWKEYQDKRAEPGQIQDWLKRYPESNIAIVTGKISGLDVLDIDSAEGMKQVEDLLQGAPDTPTALTPRGGSHLYFSHQDGLVTRAGVMKDVDVRTDQGYIIAPPSIGSNGKPYAWLPGYSMTDRHLAAWPAVIYNKINAGREGGAVPSIPGFPQPSSTFLNLLKKGTRDATIFHIANCLVKGGMESGKVLELLALIGKQCDPPFPENEIIAKVQSAMNRASSRERNLSQEVREWVLSSNGIFFSSEILKELQISSSQDKKNVSNILSRMLNNEGVIERVGNRNGQYRRIENECEAIDFLGAETAAADIWLPFDLHNMVEIMPGNIILVAGNPNAGKTGLMLNIIKANMGKHEIHYFNSEMGNSELKKRLMLFDDIDLKEWKFKAWERSGNFADVIKPGKGKLNIIDFLELHENFYEIGGKLAEIHNRLKGAIAIVALQKNPGLDVGLGGYRSLEKPRLALAMEAGSLKIVKAKNWKTTENPNGKSIQFTVEAGCRFRAAGPWKMGK